MQNLKTWRVAVVMSAGILLSSPGMAGEKWVFQSLSLNTVRGNVFNGTVTISTAEGDAEVVMTKHSYGSHCEARVAVVGHDLVLSLENNSTFPALFDCKVDFAVKVPGGVEVDVKQDRGWATLTGEFSKVRYGLAAGYYTFNGSVPEHQVDCGAGNIAMIYRSLSSQSTLAVNSGAANIKLFLPAATKLSAKHSSAAANFGSDFLNASDPDLTADFTGVFSNIEIKSR